MRQALVFAVLLGACTAAPEAPVQGLREGLRAHPLAWMSGCWERADGTYREVWSAPEHGYLFGYALTLENDKPVFFEQSRIDPGATFTFNAYPAGKGPSAFQERFRSFTRIEFVNAAHDYPQVVAYEQTKGGLTASISLEDDTQRQDFVFRPCKD